MKFLTDQQKNWFNMEINQLYIKMIQLTQVVINLHE